MTTWTSNRPLNKVFWEWLRRVFAKAWLIHPLPDSAEQLIVKGHYGSGRLFHQQAAFDHPNSLLNLTWPMFAPQGASSGFSNSTKPDIPRDKGEKEVCLKSKVSYTSSKTYFIHAYFYKNSINKLSWSLKDALQSSSGNPHSHSWLFPSSHGLSQPGLKCERLMSWPRLRHGENMLSV